MGGIDGVLAAAAGRVQTSIDVAVLNKVMDQAKVQQQAVAEMIDAVAETARAMTAAAAGGVDVYA
jgi:hypothetical protein